MGSGKVDVAGRTAAVVCREQYLAFENEPVNIFGSGKTGQKPFQCIEMKQLLSGRLVTDENL